MTVASFREPILNTWVESGKCRLISCQRILVPCWDSNSRTTHFQSSALNHSTTTLPQSTSSANLKHSEILYDIQIGFIKYFNLTHVLEGAIVEIRIKRKRYF